MKEDAGTSSSQVSDETPIFLRDCNSLLPQDRSCQRVRLTQFLLPGCFGKPTGGKSPGHYCAIVQPQYLGRAAGEEIDKKEIEADVDQRVAALEKRLHFTSRLHSGSLLIRTLRSPT